MPPNFESSKENYAYRTYIKDLYLELPDYKHHHSSLDGSEHEIFVGRGENSKKIEDTLNSSEENGNGSYLVTGYRGMGKTSLVNNVISKYKRKKISESILIRRINVNFSQSNLDETGILKQMVQNIIHDIERNPLIRFSTIATLKNIYLIVSYFVLMYLFFNKATLRSLQEIEIDALDLNAAIPILIAITFISFTIVFLKRFIFWIVRLITLLNPVSPGYVNYVETLSKRFFIRNAPLFPLLTVFTIMVQSQIYLWFTDFQNQDRNTILTIALHLTFFLCIQIWVFINSNDLIKYFYEMVIAEKKIYDKLTDLMERCNANVTSEVGLQNAGDNFILGFIDKRTKTYPIANSKEIENEIIHVLKEYDKFVFYKKKYIIVFDELDKIETSSSLSPSNYDDKSLQSITESTQKEIIELSIRKKIILNILSSLKYFTTEAKARFIFIAGREMFDASLADIADRQSSISSIFHQIIYLDSFLKDKGSLGLARGLTNLVEEYLQYILIPASFRITKPEDSTNSKIKTSSSFIKKYYHYLREKQGNSLEQDLKIIYNIQNFIIYLTYRSNGSPKKLVKLVEEYIESKEPTNEDLAKDNYKSLHVKGAGEGKVLFIRFSYKSQYKFAFISYLYRPFILNFSQFIKQYSDNVLVSTPFLMDHLIKFHPFAFSIQNLELLPEVISNNRNPILRFFIEELIAFLGENHIRETEIGLFEYKFINKTSDEILYLSKVFEAESAAFNFTLNETDLVKSYIQSKIREAGRNGILQDQGRNYQLSFLYSLLGDAYYFDQEFDNAIISYQSGLGLLETPLPKYLGHEKFVILIRFKLKLGLIYEKMKSYDLALGVYNDSISDTLAYFQTSVKSSFGDPVQSGFESESREKFGSLSNLLQTVNQTLLASMYLVEKLSLEGIGLDSLERYHQVYNHIVTQSLKDNRQSGRATANYYNNVGNLLYYKNFKVRGIANTNISGVQPDGVAERFATKIKALICSDFAVYSIDQRSFKPSNEDGPNEWQYPQSEPNLVFDSNEQESWINSAGDPVTKTNKDYRFSFHAFISYKHAFTFLTDFQVGEIGQEKCLLDMFLKCSDMNFNFQNHYDKTYLKNIANSISNIANQFFTIINTKSQKFDSATILTEAVAHWHGKMDRILEGYNLIHKGYIELVGPSKLKDNPNACGFIRDGLKKLHQNWYTHDQLKQSIIQTYNELGDASDAEMMLHLDQIRRLLSVLEEKKSKDKFKHGILAFWDKYIYEYFKKYQASPDKNSFHDLDTIILLYYLSGRFYSRAGKSQSFSFQLKKILHVLKNTVRILPHIDKKGDVAWNQVIAEQKLLLALVEETFLFQILEITSWVSNSTDRPQIYKYKDAQNIDTIYHPPHFAKLNYFNTSNASAIKEAIYLFADIQLNSFDFKKYNSVEDCKNDIPEFSLMSPYNIVSTQYSRILELDLQEKLNRAMLKGFLFSKIFSNDVLDLLNGDDVSDGKSSIDPLTLWEDRLFGPYKRYGVDVANKDDENLNDPAKRSKIKGKDCGQLEENIELALWKIVDNIFNDKPGYRDQFLEYQKVVANSLYSLRQIVSSIRIQGVNYYISYSYLAFFHFKLGTWYKHYALCRSILRRLRKYHLTEQFNNLDQYIHDLLGTDGIITLDSTSQFQIALQYYHKAKQMHSNGLEYERTLKNLIYLEDDFNDNLYHFGIALERQRLNSYHIRRRIKRLENELKDSPLYRYDSFTGNKNINDKLS